jgi:hypothetical protein
MSIPGDFAVNQTGAATYTIPIRVPPGVAGAEPKLSLVYNSQGANGLVGLGWNLSGLSAITRCAQTAAQDGGSWVSGINYTGTDKYCLDGRRLINVADPSGSANATPGAYGADKTYYSTELESSVRIQSFSDGNPPASGPKYFIVKTADGLTMEYGVTTDSRAPITNGSGVAVASPVVRVWALNKVIDAVGNYMLITYNSNDWVNGECYPIRINYTGNARASTALEPGFQVEFIYEDRPDIFVKYRSGYIVRSTRRLSKILAKTASGIELGSRYELSYTVSEATGRSQLASVKQSASTGESHPLTEFTWTTGGRQFVDKGIAVTGALSGWGQATDRIRVVDLDGNRRQDILAGPDAGGNWYLLESNGTSFVNRGSIISGAYGAWDTSSNRIRVMDINGDNRSDVVIGPDANGTWFWLEGTSEGKLVDRGALITGAYAGWAGAPGRIWVIDADGDDRQDILLGPDAAGKWYLLKSSGTTLVNQGFVVSGAYGAWDTSANRIRLMDIDGDGRKDIVIGPDAVGKWYWLKFSAAGQLEDKGALISGAYAGWASATDRIRVVDANDDELQDILMGPDGAGKWYLLQSNGVGFIDRGAVVSGAYAGYDSGSGPGRIRAMDINADGQSDVLLGPDDNRSWYALRSNGSGFVNDGTVATLARLDWGSAMVAPHVFPADVDGDGTTDIVLGPGASGNWYWMVGLGDAEVITRISTGLCAITYAAGGTKCDTINIIHAPLPWQATRSQAVTAPQVAVAPHMPVVKYVKSFNGVIGDRYTQYFYDTPVVEIGTGRGFLGFAKVSAWDSDSWSSSDTTYRLDWPYVGMINEKRVYLGAPTTAESSRTYLSIMRIDYTCQNPVSAPATVLPGSGASALAPGQAGNCTTAPGSRYQVWASRTSERFFDAAGTGMAGKRTDVADVDKFGNAARVSVFTLNGDGTDSGHTQVTDSWYSNNVADWVLGRLLRSNVTVTAP